MTDDNRNKFSRLAAQYNQRVNFYNVEELFTNKIAEIEQTFPQLKSFHFSIATFYRFFIPQTLPAEIEKVIYLDADIIVNLDLKELWEIDLGDKPLGAVPNLFQIKDEKTSIERSMKGIYFCKNNFVKPEDYFNAGVLLLNLKLLRNSTDLLKSGIKFVSEKPTVQYFDQDVLNYCFSTLYLKLPVKFNRYVMLARPENELTVEKKIYHYAGGKVGLGVDMSDPFNRLWWSCFIKTPWFGVDTLNNILKCATDYMSRLPAVPSGKSRIFIVDEEHADQIEKNFSVRDAEKVIIVDPNSEKSLQKLSDLMDDLKGNNIFFVAIPNFYSKSMKFLEGNSFFNVSNFYSPMWMDLKNNYNFIMSM